MNLDDKIKDRKQKFIGWFKEPWNLMLIGVILLAFAIRLYFFLKTSGQALWWDEAEYMSTAKHWAFDVPYELNPQRPPLFQLLAAFAFMMGFGENFIKFSLTVVPSVFLVYLIYLLGSEMFDKRIGLIAAFLASVSWTFAFWSSRIQPDFASMTFQVLSVFFMWKYWKESKTKLIFFAGIFAAIGFMFKVSGLLVPLSFMFFILVKDRRSGIFNKDYYIFSFAFLATLTPYFVWAYRQFGTIFAFSAGYSNAIGTTTPFAWYTLKFFYLLSENILFVLFVIGLIISLKFLLYADVLVKDKKKCFDAGLFSVIVLAVVSAFYIFYIRGAEDRWVFLWLPFVFMMIGNALMFVYNIGKKYTKIVSVVIVLVLLGVGSYLQVTHASSIVDMKKDSYMPVKQSGLWMKENSNKGDLVWSLSMTQHTYYSERNVSNYNTPIKNASMFEDFVRSNRPRFVVASVFEPVNTPWLQEWLAENLGNVSVVQAYFADETRRQPVLIVYEINR